jgi:putative transposase
MLVKVQWAKRTDLCRKHWISSATFYKWKPKYGGLEVPDARRLKTLEDENAELLAAAMLGNAMLTDILEVLISIVAAEMLTS